MLEFYKKLNASPWKGSISEVGLGMEFSSNLMLVPGASNTVVSIHCDYMGVRTKPGVRRVSLENARREARHNFRLAEEACNNQDGIKLFGLSVTGAHYEDRDSHGWIYLKTKEFDAHMHFSIGETESRAQLGGKVKMIIKWLMSYCLLPQDRLSWAEESRSLAFQIANVDVLYAPGVGDVERLMLITPENALVYHEGKFHRVTDYLRVFHVIYPGAFNPPTEKHLTAHGHCIYEISQRHYYKGDMSIEDLMHRMRMLDAAGKPVLLTNAPRFVDKYDIAACHIDWEEQFVIFLVGADAWNMTIIQHQYPSIEWLHEKMPFCEFLVMEREGIDINENAVSKPFKFDVIHSDPSLINHSSTAVREATTPESHPFLTEEVAAYIKAHNLYWLK